MTKKRSPLLPIILSIVIGILVVILLTNVLNPVPVVVSTGPIAPGTILIPELVEIRTIPAQARPANAFANLDDVIGKCVTVGRSGGDFITQDVLGDVSQSGIPSQLPVGHVAMAVNIDRSSGIGGILRAGQQVSVVGLISPEVLQYAQSQYSGFQVAIPSDPFPENGFPTPVPTPIPTSSPPQSVLSKILITGLNVLLVPQSFRYEELPASSSEEALFATARMASSNQTESIIILDVPATAVEVWPGYVVSPVALLAALNQYGEIHLLLESSDGLDLEGKDMVTLNLGDLYQQMNKERWVQQTIVKQETSPIVILETPTVTSDAPIEIQLTPTEEN